MAAFLGELGQTDVWSWAGTGRRTGHWPLATGDGLPRPGLARTLARLPVCHVQTVPSLDSSYRSVVPSM
jgi:hypothetical protein